jgi:hypothetical protein
VLPPHPAAKDAASHFGVGEAHVQGQLPPSGMGPTGGYYIKELRAPSLEETAAAAGAEAATLAGAGDNAGRVSVEVVARARSGVSAAAAAAAQRIAMVEWGWDNSATPPDAAPPGRPVAATPTKKLGGARAAEGRAPAGAHPEIAAPDLAMPVGCGSNFGAADAHSLAGLGQSWADLPAQVRWESVFFSGCRVAPCPSVHNRPVRKGVLTPL